MTTRHRSSLLPFLVATALVVAACGGDDDDGLGDLVDEAADDAASADEPADGSSDDGADDGATDEGPGFGEFTSGEIVVTGAEEATFAVDDPALGFISGGGCGGENYGISVNVQDADAQTTIAQIGVNIDEDLSGGRTGTFPADEVSFFIVPEGGDMSQLRSYEGPGTLDVIEHDNAAPSFDLNSRRTTLAITGTLAATSPDLTGTVELDANLVWVMGCP